MKRITSCVVSLVLTGVLFMGCSKKEAAPAPSSDYERQSNESEAQEERARNKGRGLATAIGAGVGTVVAGPLGAVAVGAIANKLATGKGKVAEEFINVETHLAFSTPGGDEEESNITKVYGDESGNVGNFFIPRFKTKDDIYLNVSFTPSLRKTAAKKATKEQKSTEFLIPVEIVITKSEGIEISPVAGTSNVYYETDIDGTTKASLYIKNDPSSHPSLRIKFHPAASGTAEVHVNYGKDDYKVVDMACDVFQTMEFED